MQLNEIETLVIDKFNSLEKELEKPVTEWVTKKLKDFKEQNRSKKVKILSGNGTWCFLINGKSLDELNICLEQNLFPKQTEKYKILKEIDETLRLLAGEKNIYLQRDIEL